MDVDRSHLRLRRGCRQQNGRRGLRGLGGSGRKVPR
jgi:hypothetical protein